MTITVSTPPQSELALASPRVPRKPIVRSRPERSTLREIPQIDVMMFAELLEDPAIALWAGEAATKYQVSALGALGLLAHALLVDSDR